MPTREERERGLLSDLAKKFGVTITEPKVPKAAPGRRPADDDDDGPGEIIIATGRKAARIVERFFGDAYDDADRDDDDQADDDGDGDGDDQADEPDAPEQDAPPKAHGFYRTARRR